MEVVGTFALSLGAPRTLVPSTGADSTELARVDHFWQLRDTFLTLLVSPPPTLHCVVFDVKSVVCALLVHLRVPFLGAQDLPQLSDVLVAAWLLDPDDNRKNKSEASSLMNSYCGSLLSKQQRGPGRKKPAEPGDNDIAVMLQDMGDMHALLDTLARRLRAENLLRPYIAQEMCLQPVLIDMQATGRKKKKHSSDNNKDGRLNEERLGGNEGACSIVRL